MSCLEANFPTNPPPQCNSWFIYCMTAFIHQVLFSTMFRDFKHSSSPTAGRAGQIVQSGVWFWNIQMRWNLNEGRLWSVGRCTAKTRSLLSFARVFFFSWIEYQLISWVICCSDNWVKGWEQTAHIQASHQGTVDNKRVPLNSWFSLYIIIELVAVQLMCTNSAKIGKMFVHLI